MICIWLSSKARISVFFSSFGILMTPALFMRMNYSSRNDLCLTVPVKEPYIKADSFVEICIIEINCKLITKSALVSWLCTTCISVFSWTKVPGSTFSNSLSVTVIKPAIQPTRTIINPSCGWHRFVIFRACISARRRLSPTCTSSRPKCWDELNCGRCAVEKSPVDVAAVLRVHGSQLQGWLMAWTCALWTCPYATPHNAICISAYLYFLFEIRLPLFPTMSGRFRRRCSL